MIKKYSLKALQKTINTALKLDNNIDEKFLPLNGKFIQIIVTPLNVQFFMTFTNNQLILLADYTGQPDTCIQSNPLGLIRLSLLPVSKARSLFNDQIKITGDPNIGNQVKLLFDQLDIDWEGHLANFTGDVIAHQIGSLVRRGVAFRQQLTKSMRHNITDYLQEELCVLPPAEEINDFFNMIDILVNDVERLQAQINLLIKIP